MNCDHDCGSCGENCAERDPKSLLEKPREDSHIKKVIGVVSGKGGVGKSMVTSLLAVAARRAGLSAAILDADITGPSIPTAFGITERPVSRDGGLCPVYSESGIGIMSLNLLLENATDPVVWRGPIISGTVKQFWTDVIWGDVDVLFIDMPPGTGDVALTVFQSLPLDGIVIVTTPQELVGMIVTKAVRMAEMLDIPVLALVENMSYFQCPDCGGKHEIFGKSRVEELAKELGVPNTARLPMDPKLSAMCDAGKIEQIEGDWLADISAALK